MSEKRYTVEMAIYKRREGSSNIGVNYIRDNYSKNNKTVKCCGRNYVDVEVPESAIVFGDTNRHIINKVCERLNELNDEKQLLKEGYEEYRKLSIQFKERINELISDNTFLQKENEQLKKENKALKMELKRLYGEEEDDDDYDLWIKKQVKRSRDLE